MNYPLPLGLGSATGPCMCGATDCPSCGPAQGYRLDDDFDIEAEVERLTAEGAEYDPCNGRNLSEALGEMPESLYRMLGQKLRENNEHEAFIVLQTYTNFYWSGMARKHAQKVASHE